MISGDNRDYCEVAHEIPGSDDIAREVTVKSFSPSQHIHRPGFQLLSLVPPSSSRTGPTFADTACHLPDTQRVFHSIYVPCFILTALVLLYVNLAPSRHRNDLINLSPMSLTRSGRSSPPPEPESAIWATRTPLKSSTETSPIAPLPLSARISASKYVPSYRASPAATPRDSPLLSPITLFPSGDEGDVEEDRVGASHYNVRRDLHYANGWEVEHRDDDDDDARERDTPLDHPHSHRPARLVSTSAPYFLPPPLSQQPRARWSYSWTFVFRGRRRRMTFGVPDWKTWWGMLSSSTAKTGPRRRGVVWRLVGDCVSVALPAIVAWTVIGWLAF